jgi:predicted trehalose synthase
MKGTIKTTFTEVEKVREYAELSGFKSPSDLIRKAVHQYMRQYKISKNPDIEVKKVLKQHDNQIEIINDSISKILEILECKTTGCNK